MHSGMSRMIKLKHFATPLLMCMATMAVAQTTYKVDAKETRMVWTGKKLTGQHQGGVNVSSGSVQWGAVGLESAEVVMDMTSISTTDMDAEYGGQLERQLKSSDFFNTGTFKTASFATTKVEPIIGVEAGKPNYNVTGDLTIKGISKPVSLAVLAWKDKKGVRAAGTLAFDRTLYDIKYRSGQFFPGLGDKMIEDMVEITFDLTAK